MAELRNQPPPVIDRKSPAAPPRSSASPSPPPAPPAPTRPIQTTEIYLPQYCPSLVQQVNENPRYLNRFRNEAKNQFVEELHQYKDLKINEVTHQLLRSPKVLCLF